MKVLVIGGTRGVGRAVVVAAHAAGTRSRCWRATRRGFAVPVTGVRVVAGDAGDAADIERAVAGQDAVVWTVGIAPTRKPVDVFSRGTQFLLAAMAQHGVRRLICVTGWVRATAAATAASSTTGSCCRCFMKSIYEDKDRQEALLRASDARLDHRPSRPR